MDKEIEKELRDGFERRFRNLINRSKKYGLPIPDKELIWKKVVESYESGFYCEYCREKMEIHSQYHDFSHVWSLDHKIPISEGGSNEPDNIAIVCTRCNLVKATLPDYAFKIAVRAMKERMDGSSYEKAMQMAFRGALANKIDRVKKE